MTPAHRGSRDIVPHDSGRLHQQAVAFFIFVFVYFRVTNNPSLNSNASISLSFKISFFFIKVILHNCSSTSTFFTHFTHQSGALFPDMARLGEQVSTTHLDWRGKPACSSASPHHLITASPQSCSLSSSNSFPPLRGALPHGLWWSVFSVKSEPIGCKMNSNIRGERLQVLQPNPDVTLRGVAALVNTVGLFI